VTLRSSSYRVPGGRLSIIVDSRALGDRDTDYGSVVAATFRPLADEDYGHLGDQSIRAGHVPEVRAAVANYADGDLAALDSVAVVQPGGHFQQSAWKALRRVPAGTVVTYAGLAAKAGSRDAYRAAGTACASNLIAVLVPCHRVLASTGLGGYGYGLEIKVALLEHEGALL